MKKIFFYFLGSLLLLFAYFQLNDPDPAKWVPIYLLPAFLAFKEAHIKTEKNFLNGLAVGYIVAALLQWPPAFEGFLFGELKMRSVNIELARESGGLLIVAVCLFVISKSKSIFDRS